jgi:hypothetical protein
MTVIDECLLVDVKGELFVLLAELGEVYLFGAVLRSVFN